MGDTLKDVIQIIDADSHSAASLTLYALMCTLEIERSGCMFKLNKLRDLNEEQRKIAFQLINLMLEKRCESAEWQHAKEYIDDKIRGG